LRFIFFVGIAVALAGAAQSRLLSPAAAASGEQDGVATGARQSASAPAAPDGTVELVPGIALPRHGMVWALDTIHGKPMLRAVSPHPVHIDKHEGANLARALTKGKASIEVYESQAPIQLMDPGSIFVARMISAAVNVPGTNQLVSNAAPEDSYQLIRVHPHVLGRTVHQLEYGSFLQGDVKRYDDLVKITITRISDSGWLKVVPSQPLPPGEYALEVRMPDAFSYSTAVYDFGVSN
jgi:hypothetical protein